MSDEGIALKLAKKRGRRLNKKSTWQLSLLAIPAVVITLVFSYLPMTGIILAFKNFKASLGVFKSPWVGLKNFEFFFTSKDAWLVVRNTLGYNIAGIVIGTVLAVLFALLLNEIRNRKWIKFYQTVFFFPYFFSWVIVSYMVYTFMSGSPMGILVTLLHGIGIDISKFYLTPTYWPPFLVFLNVWKGLGYSAVIYYAAVLGLPADCFEAAVVDGASRWQTIRRVTLPLLVPLISILTLLSVGRIFYSDFGLYYFIPNQIKNLLSVTETIDTYVYKLLVTSPNIGMAAAAGFFQSIMGFVVVLTANFVVKKINPENSIF